MFERQRGRNREISYLVVHFPNVHNSQGLARSKLGIRNVAQISQVSGWENLGGSRNLEWGTELVLEPRCFAMGCGCPKGQYKCYAEHPPLEFKVFASFGWMPLRWKLWKSWFSGYGHWTFSPVPVPLQMLALRICPWTYLWEGTMPPHSASLPAQSRHWPFPRCVMLWLWVGMGTLLSATLWLGCILSPNLQESSGDGRESLWINQASEEEGALQDLARWRTERGTF